MLHFNLTEELDLPPIEAVKLDDVTEDLTHYEDNHQINYSKQQCYICICLKSLKLLACVGVYCNYTIPYTQKVRLLKKSHC